MGTNAPPSRIDRPMLWTGRPAGKEQNWLPTLVGKTWFPYFRLYSPKQEFRDEAWVLPDIEKAK